jgi:phosphohistidine phosphatase
LSEFGREQVRSVGRLAAANESRPAAVFHSGILRAQQTAEILRRELGINREPAPMSGLLPEDDPFIARAELDSAADPVMLVGHLPHLQRLAALLVVEDSERRVVEFAPATVVCLTRAGAHWQIEWVIGPEDSTPR